MVSKESTVSLFHCSEYFGVDSPITVHSTNDRGRFVVAKRDIQAGELLLHSDPYAMIISKAFRKSACGVCSKIFFQSEIQATIK
jgi:hypothetical protein